jgi:hypothetical protein
MTVEAIKAAIEQLSDPERRQLAEWLAELEEQAWDAEMERDFSPGGRGERLLEEINQEINEGKISSLREGLSCRSEQR